MTEWQPQYQQRRPAGPPATPPQWQQDMPQRHYQPPQPPRPPHPQYLPQPYAPQYPSPQQYQQVAPRSPGLALLISLFVPGIGACYGGMPGWGIAIFVLWALSWPALFLVIGFLTLPLAWVLGLIVSYQSARRWNHRHGIIS